MPLLNTISGYLLNSFVIFYMLLSVSVYVLFWRPVSRQEPPLVNYGTSFCGQYWINLDEKVVAQITLSNTDKEMVIQQGINESSTNIYVYEWKSSSVNDCRLTFEQSLIFSLKLPNIKTTKSLKCLLPVWLIPRMISGIIWHAYHLLSWIIINNQNRYCIDSLLK